MDRANVDNEYTYNKNGNLTKDLNKNITSITYNALNLPNVITYSNNNTVTYTYDGLGSKLSVAYYNKSESITTKIEYVGNKVYMNGTLSMLLTEEGYATVSGTPVYYYYLKDHQGNNQVVINQAGTVQEVNHYYPFGGLFGEGTQPSIQRYKYNGKELDREMELDMYGYGARHYDAALDRWFTIDPMAEEYYGWSLYSYIGNNPITYIDPNGIFRTKFGGWLYKLFNGGEEILRDKGGEYFVSQKVDYEGDDPGITVKRSFDWKGRTEGKDLGFESEKMRI